MEVFEKGGKVYQVIAFLQSGFNSVFLGVYYGNGIEKRPTQYAAVKRLTYKSKTEEESTFFDVKNPPDYWKVLEQAKECFHKYTADVFYDICVY